MYRTILTILTIMSTLSCNNPADHESTASATKDSIPGTFAYDLQFLRRYDSVIVLESGTAKAIVSPKYQGKVFTSTNAGDKGPSFGWIHYKAFDGPVDPHMNAYGGENRLWLGPEGGPYSLYFPPGAKMEFANWKTPAAFDTEPWDVTDHSVRSVSLKKNMQLTNYAGTQLKLSITRSITLLDGSAIDSLLGLPFDASVQIVGYTTVNTLTNTGDKPWTETTGMPCIWLLDMFKPSPSAVIVIPYNGDTPKPATTDYFGEIPSDRIKYEGNTLFFKADGKSRGKLGIHPRRARHLMGSYDAEHNLLTLTQFDVDSSARYLNQEWTTSKPPFSGDAVNAYNDGPLADGSQMGPFYELESVSPAAALAPGSLQMHRHSVFHFTGTEASLDKICRQTLGLPVEKIKTIFK
jgi:hypothetical protein